MARGASRKGEAKMTSTERVNRSVTNLCPKVFLAVPKAGKLYYICCAARPVKSYRGNLNRNKS